MTLRYADSFMAALRRLTRDEQAAVMMTTVQIHESPDHPSLQLHRVDRSKDPNFWTARVSRDIRIVLHKHGAETLLAHVDHHDNAYAWAERRRLDVHPKTGAAQMVQVRERVEEIVVPVYRTEEVAKPPLFADTPEETLLLCGVPEDWIGDVRAATEDTLMALAAHLPGEAIEALIDLSAGIAPTPPPAPADPFEHPDAQRHFRLVTGDEELARALEAPWDDWAVFLHPAQREFVERDFAGPARITGSAGTGKTVVALHRAVRLAGEGGEGSRVLLATFDADLAAMLGTKLDRLASGDARARIEASDLRSALLRLHERAIGPVRIATDEEVAAILEEARARANLDVDPRFLHDEWRLVIDTHGIADAATYRNLPRMGRRKRLAGAKREALWEVFADVREELRGKERSTYFGALHRLAGADIASAYDHCIVDEAQDIALPELRVLAAIAGDRPNGLFFAGDIGQRIFRPAFAWSGAGVEVRGRSRALRVSYRTSRQIRERADGLLPSTLVEIDGSEEGRGGIRSVFEGPPPDVRIEADEEDEIETVAAWLRERAGEGIADSEIVVLVRSEAERGRAQRTVEASGLLVSIAPMHTAKGREFRAVAVMACDESVIPSEARLRGAEDEAALAEIYATERHLLYVACTRARDRLLVTAVEPPSEFLDDLSA